MSRHAGDLGTSCHGVGHRRRSAVPPFIGMCPRSPDRVDRLRLDRSADAQARNGLPVRGLRAASPTWQVALPARHAATVVRRPTHAGPRSSSCRSSLAFARGRAAAAVAGDAASGLLGVRRRGRRWRWPASWRRGALPDERRCRASSPPARRRGWPRARSASVTPPGGPKRGSPTRCRRVGGRRHRARRRRRRSAAGLRARHALRVRRRAHR